MTTPRLIPITLVVAALTAAGACNRAEPNEEAREAAADVRAAAARAGDELADGWLTTKVQAQFFVDEDVKARYIDVDTDDAVVTLKGFVENEQVRLEAEQIARNTDGVKEVNNQLLIGAAPASMTDRNESAPSASDSVATTGRSDTDRTLARIDDARITATIQAKYFLDTVVKARRIDVDTAGGVVTLGGEVASDEERAQALLIARSTEGVQRVEDHLTVNTSLAAPPVVPSQG